LAIPAANFLANAAIAAVPASVRGTRDLSWSGWPLP